METIAVLTDGLRERTVSFDIDVNALRTRAKKYGLARADHIPVPLGILNKGLILDFDLRNSRGEAVSLFNSAEDSAMVGLVGYVAAGGLPSHCRERAFEIMRDVALDFPTADAVMQWYVHDDAKTPIVPDVVSQMSPSDRKVWQYLVASEHGSLIERMAVAFVPTTWYDLGKGEELFKLRRVEDERDPLIELLKRTHARNARASAIPGAGLVAVRVSETSGPVREHIRLVAPPGTFFAVGVFLLWNATSPIQYEYRDRQTHTRQIFYPGKVSEWTRVRSRYVFSLMLPNPQGVMRPVLLWTWTIFILLLAGAIAQLSPFEVLSYIHGSPSSPGAMVDAAVTVLLIIPSIGLAYVVRSDENDVRHTLLRYVRGWALFCLIPVLLASLALFVDLSNDKPLLGLIWLACAGVVGLSLRINLLTSIRLRRFLREVERAAANTSLRQIVSEPKLNPFRKLPLSVRTARAFILGVNFVATLVPAIIRWIGWTAVCLLGFGLILSILGWFFTATRHEDFSFYGVVIFQADASLLDFFDVIAGRIRELPATFSRAMQNSERGLVFATVAAAVAMVPVSWGKLSTR
ncbi:hypothetical protein QCD70_11015 [Agreia sp. PsM10]|uniref:hypothetical protein n=1 Tax=Agreia sp. PsM10 TaxID=3030533 RepID=UPI00263AC175|nr:hypothetical protein [Agreia sp. PsM10]MDN4640775.1 hypothetical protein [Agreia sp. PsM10]